MVAESVVCVFLPSVPSDRHPSMSLTGHSFTWLVEGVRMLAVESVFFCLRSRRALREAERLHRLHWWR